MTFTTEEHNKMVGHIEKIIDYIRENVQPHLRDFISIRFQATYHTCLTIYKNKICYDQAYGNEKPFCKASELTDKNIMYGSGITLDDTAMFDFIKYWSFMKMEISNKLREQQDIIDTIDNFEL
jgi:hypothetical protein